MTKYRHKTNQSMNALNYDNLSAMLGQTMNPEIHWIENGFDKRITNRSIPHLFIIILITMIIIYLSFPEFWLKIIIMTILFLSGIVLTVYIAVIYRKRVVRAVQIQKDGLQIKYKNNEKFVAYSKIKMFSFLDELDKTIIVQIDSSSSIQLELGIENNNKLMTLLKNKHPSYIYEDGGFYSVEFYRKEHERMDL